MSMCVDPVRENRHLVVISVVVHGRVSSIHCTSVLSGMPAPAGSIKLAPKGDAVDRGCQQDRRARAGWLAELQGGPLFAGGWQPNIAR